VESREGSFDGAQDGTKGTDRTDGTQAARRRVFVCSPYRGTPAEVEQNILVARAICRRAAEMGYAPFAPHLLYTQITDEASPEERELGILMGLAWMPCCDEVWSYPIGQTTPGMLRELAEARRLGKRIVRLARGWLVA
jgi:hypothetical protein